MQYVSTTDARSTFSDMIDKVQKEPIIIQRQNKDVAVMISPAEYEKLRRIKIQELDDICVRASARAKAMGLTEEKLAQLLAEDD